VRQKIPRKYRLVLGRCLHPGYSIGRPQVRVSRVPCPNFHP
jgi:hypothetical protein